MLSGRRWLLPNRKAPRMRCGLFAAIMLAGCLAATNASARDHDANWSRCKNDRLEIGLRIDACTAVIEVDQRRLAIFALLIGGVAEAAKREGAIQLNANGFVAIREMAKDLASAFYNRGLAYGREGRRNVASSDCERAIRLDRRYLAMRQVCSPATAARSDAAGGAVFAKNK